MRMVYVLLCCRCPRGRLGRRGPVIVVEVVVVVVVVVVVPVAVVVVVGGGSVFCCGSCPAPFVSGRNTDGNCSIPSCSVFLPSS